MGFVIIALIIIFLLIVISNIAVVQQSRAYVIERLGKYKRTWSAGLHLLIPLIDRIAKKVLVTVRK